MASDSTVAVVQEGCFMSRIRHAVKAIRRLLIPTRAPFQRRGPPFRSPHDLPTEIILQIADCLDEVSLLALRHTNRDLLYIVLLEPDQVLSLRKTRVIGHINNRYDKNRVHCTGCQRLRPLAAFSLSELIALQSLQQASCLRHS